MKQHHQLNISRHHELFDPYEFHQKVHIIGAGATGSWLALALAKLGITDITVYDFDKVEEHNVPNQAFGINHIGMPKVGALNDMLQEQVNLKEPIKANNTKYTNQPLSGIVFLMVDSMSERKRIWQDCIKYQTQIKLMVEPRMGLDMTRIYVVNPVDVTQIEKYEATLYDDDVAEVSACGTSMSVITTAMATASWCARQLISWHNNDEIDNQILIDYKYNNLVTTRW
jgi:hypothetical protein